MNVIDQRMNIRRPSMLPGCITNGCLTTIRVEKGLSPDTVRLLREKGHTLSLQARWEHSSSILIDPESRVRYGASDPEGKARRADTEPLKKLF